MTIAIIGGTGTLGQHVAAELEARGHKVRALSRHAPEYRVDLATGDGLGPALAGCDVVVDASNSSARKPTGILVDGARRLLEAEAAAGVKHHVCVSIVGCGEVPMGYYRAKTDQERVVSQGAVPWSIVRSTQFHELVGVILTAAGRWRVLPMPPGVLQPVACADAARAIADVAEGAPLNRCLTVAGPEVREVRDLARTWREVTGHRAVLIPMPVPGTVGRALRSGALTAPRPDVRGAMGFADWLRTAPE
ncbi:MAG TPA: NAD(P)H-binding protein [Streptosporangiaceae bacterium]|nr:NAD(P)H-binding protein [Streptosporangiaceae bacterium]